MRRAFVVSGRVQGVGFRLTTQREGRRQGLAGWVRNEADGSVRTLADGDDRAVEAFVAFLHEGPSGARVTEVREVEPGDEPVEGFEIR